jgi:sialidase-1
MSRISSIVFYFLLLTISTNNGIAHSSSIYLSITNCAGANFSRAQLQVENDLEHFIVFTKGEGDYHTYRIPSIVHAKNGALIAIVEARRDNSGDPGRGHIDLVYKLSHDGGRNWSPLRIFEKSQEGWGASNPTAVVESTKGRIIVLYNVWKPGRGSHLSNYSRPGTLDNQLWMRFSDDHGYSWSDAEDITHQGRDVERWGNAVFGPGHGIETRTGRLIIPVNAPGKFDDDSLKTASFALYSDDGGKSWKRGQQINAHTTENQIVELDDGRLMIDARQKDAINTRWMAISNDQGQTWTQPEPSHISAQICASIIKYPQPNHNNSLLIWSGIKGPGRTNLILRLSKDQGQSFPVELLIGQGPTAYSVLTLLDKGDVGILWEGGKESPYEKIIFTRIPRDVIMQLHLLSTVNKHAFE